MRRKPFIDFEGPHGQHLGPKKEEPLYAELNLNKPGQKNPYKPVRKDESTVYSTVNATTTNGKF